ncbi:DNA internalization-related competence protein ComEC/Rec2 [Butyrivibrio sp. AC2005]|uniref:DNA internalization-related competence protein ComEC/Rec2 n=1 Tax=Butyrivibrio sp. AC2005 TaxID=1280672 RepID=UPI0003F57DC3|nr:DNA internalization-related competence protein ComEC/Rec2 [Butyrivibrio sp. AC2005]
MKRPLCFVGAFFAIAVFFLLQFLPAEEYSVPRDRESITVTGIINGKEEKTSSFTGKKQLVLYLRMDSGRIVLIYLDDMMYKLPIGCVLKVRGNVKNFSESRNPGEFDSREYYRILKTEYSLTDVEVLGIGGHEDLLAEKLYNARIYFEHVLDSVLSETDAGVMKAVLLGDRNCLDEGIKEDFKRNGIIHIMAVSGLHISIIGMTLYKLLRKLGAGIPLAAVVATTVMYMYGGMCGMSTSAFRAIVMFGVKLGADIIGRSYDMLSAMALSGIMILLANPLYIKHSGFLMSFGAVLAIGYVLPVMPEVIKSGKLKIISASLSIMLVTLPINMSFYYTYPVYSIVLNIFILPLMSVLMLLGILSIALGAFVIPLGVISGKGCHFIIKWFLLCCNVGSSLPSNTWYTGHAKIWQVTVYQIILGIFVFLGGRTAVTYVCKGKDKERRKKALDRVRYALLFTGLTVLCIRIKPQLRITALDVGQGDGIVIETKTANYLIDGGSTSKKNLAKYQLIPFLSYRGIGKLDAIIVTHEDEDHISGIGEFIDNTENVGSIRIENLILPDISEDAKGENYKALENKALSRGIKVSYIGRDDCINNASIEIRCLGPVKKMYTDEPNAYSTVLYIKKDNFKALFTGDVDGEGQELLRDYIRKNRDEFSNLTLLKVAHHGSRYTTDEEFLNLLKPRVSLISCGINNKYNHPHKEVLERLENTGTKTYITAQSGAVTASFDHQKMKVKTYID